MLCSVIVVNCLICVALVMVDCKPYKVGPDMTVSLHPGIYTFDQLVINDLFVDKTLMIQDFLENKCKVNVITRPRKWGKSVILEMFQRFLEVELNEFGIHLKIASRKNHKYFEGGELEMENKTTKILRPLQIHNDSRSMKKLGVKPVIMIKLSLVKGKNYRAVENNLKKLIKNLFVTHGYLKEYTKKENLMLNSTQKEELLRFYSKKQLDTKDMENGLFRLTRLMYDHFIRRVILLIDDYDAAINHAVESFEAGSEDSGKVLKLFQMFYQAVVNNPCVEKCLITGTLPFSEEVLFMNASNVYVHSVLDHGYSKYFGFLDTEVDELLKRVGMSNYSSVDKMKYWFTGYNHGLYILYNPLDIMGYISNKGRLLDYWADSGRIKSLDEFLVSDEAQEDLQKLLEDEGIIKPLYKYDKPDKKEDSFHFFFGVYYRLLVHHGYLNAYNHEKMGDDYLLRIPNQEIRNLFVDYKAKWFCAKYEITLSDLYDLVGCLITSQVSDLKDSITRVFENIDNSTLQGEKDYYRTMGEILTRLLNHNIIFSDKHFQIGRVYHLIIPRSKFQGHTSFILEYKLCDKLIGDKYLTRRLQESAQQVLDSIDSNIYGPMLAKYSYVDKVVTVGIAFWGKQLELAYKTFRI